MGVRLAAFPFMIHDERRCERYPYTMSVKGPIQGIWDLEFGGKGDMVMMSFLGYLTLYLGYQI